MLVGVSHVSVEDPLKVPGSEDEDTVDAFASDGADPAFRVGVRDRGAHGSPQGLNVFAAEHGVEPDSELRVAIADQEPQLAFGELIGDVAGLLSGPVSAR